MPTVLRVGGFSFGFYSDEHNPPHVRCRNADGVATIEIATSRVIRTTRKMPEKDIGRAKALVTEYRDVLQAAWEEHGPRRII